MPLHEFFCSKCATEFEELIFKEDDPVSCPDCGSSNVEKLISACKFKTGGPIVAGSPSASASPTRSSSACAGCSGGNCSSC
ncbi:FmdB family zinc ribbon protein [Desulfonatronovibrio hydrogenovorans]|uniref:FmdB family zinc ribbon protein n=1 Tax=Desulfonatronovibrio hydrogenovorans TaxID=53245 RepID=UPI00048C0AC8|nr:zinc ribbon domain-containing protein [Desulfonatronovibrio hydrogenovorans]